MADDTLRDQVAGAVCAMTTGAERTEAVMQIIREQVDAERDRWKKRLDDMTREARLSRESTGKAVARAKRAEGAIEQVRELASDDADLRSGVVGMVRVSDIRRALDQGKAAR